MGGPRRLGWWLARGTPPQLAEIWDEKNEFLLKMACFAVNSKRYFVTTLARKMLNFSSKEVIW